MQWHGVSVDTLFEIACPLPTATHVVAYSHTGYTTNLPLGDVTGGKAWIAWEVDGAPLPRDHGGPARLLVPHLYFWKSAKWVAGIRVLDHDEPGSLGSPRLPRPRRPLARAALSRRLSAREHRAERSRCTGDRTVAGRHRDGHPRRDTTRQDIPRSTFLIPRVISPVSISSCASPRPTGTQRSARTQLPRRQMTARRSSSPSSGWPTARSPASFMTNSSSATRSKYAGPSADGSSGWRDTGAAHRRRIRRRAAHGNAPTRSANTATDARGSARLIPGANRDDLRGRTPRRRHHRVVHTRPATNHFKTCRADHRRRHRSPRA